MSSPVAGVGTWHESGDIGRRAERLAASFTSTYGAEPDGVWAAPGRVNLVGEHVDYADGLCLPFALAHTTLVAAAAEPGRVVGRSTQRSEELVDVSVADVPTTPLGWGAYVAGVAAVLAPQTGNLGMRALVDSTVPVGSGLSSSAALSCAAALALDDLAGLGLAGSDAGRTELAAACVRAENEVAKAPTGGLDQAAALRARAGSALLLDCRDDTVAQVPLPLADHSLALLVVDTRAEHSHAEGAYGERRSAVEAAARRLGASTLRELENEDLEAVLARLDGSGQRAVARHVLTEIERVRRAAALLQAGDLKGIGPVLTASHASMRDDFELSCAELDLAVSSALDAGALGARMTGGGFGGSAIALVLADALPAVAAAVQRAFMAAGLRLPAFLEAVPSAAGRRIL